MDSEKTLTAEEGENSLEMEIDNKRNLQSSSEDEGSKRTLNSLFGSFVNSFSPVSRTRVKEKIVHKEKKAKIDLDFETNDS